MKNAEEIKKQIREELKKLGYNNRLVSVREDQGGLNWSFEITVKDLNINLKPIQEIADKYKQIDKCEASGEILNGGNLYIFVEYDWKLERQAA